MTTQSWPLGGLLVRAADVELRLPSPDELEALAALAADGIHDPDEMPFVWPWTDQPPQGRARSTMQWYWSTIGSLQPEAWRLGFVVVADGVVVGTQSLAAERFAVCREVHTGSWLGMRFQGQGLGTAMRTAVLDLAFHGLGAEWATSGAFADNPASLAVSRKLGYVDDGIEIKVRRDQPGTVQRLRLSRSAWLTRGHEPAELTGVEECRELLGA